MRLSSTTLVPRHACRRPSLVHSLGPRTRYVAKTIDVVPTPNTHLSSLPRGHATCRGLEGIIDVVPTTSSIERQMPVSVSPIPCPPLAHHGPRCKMLTHKHCMPVSFPLQVQCIYLVYPCICGYARQPAHMPVSGRFICYEAPASPPITEVSS